MLKFGFSETRSNSSRLGVIWGRLILGVKGLKKDHFKSYIIDANLCESHKCNHIFKTFKPSDKSQEHTMTS